jgi:hypothetical protein
MQLYTIYENGALRKVKNLNFKEDKAYLIDDTKIIYLWLGSKISKKKRDFAIKKANIINNKRDNKAKIEILVQNEEYGPFLALMDLFKKGVDKDYSIEKRPELKLEIDDTKELIQAGLDLDFEAEITLKAYEISQQKKSYKDLCKELAKIQLTLSKEKGKISEQVINRKAEEIFKSSSTYEEICWLIAELSLLLTKKK